MIIHSPIISGSLTFAQGATFTLPDNGVYSGSFSGSITGIGDPTTFSASVDTRIDQLSIDTGSQDSRLDNLEGFTSSIDTTIKTKLNTETVVSGSSQVVGILSSLNTYTGSNNTTNTAQNNRLTSLETETGSITTEQSAQDARLGSLEAATSSYQATLSVSDTTNVDLILSSNTLSANLKGGVVSGSSQITYSGISSIPAGIVSGSSQIDLTQTTNYSSGIKTRLDAEGVTSGSTHILALVSIDEDTMSSNSDTKLPTQQSVKAYVDTEISALVSGSPATLDTLNELAAALGDDPNFATTISTTIGGKVSQSLQIISGNGLTGGGNLTTNRTLAVGGTADRISVSADAVDIASTYVGQTSITTLGTISTGTWSGTVIDKSKLDDEVLNTSLNSYTASNDTTNTTQNSRLSSLEAATASLQGTDITITLTGDVTGTGTITNLGNVSFATTVAANSVALGTDTTGNYVGTITAGNGIVTSGATSGEGVAHTISVGGGVVSGSTQIDALGFLQVGGDDVVSGSATVLRTTTNFGGDVSGTYNAIVIADDSHNHIISNVDGLQSALDLKAPLASPTFTGTVIAPTPSANDNSTKVATTAYVQQELSDLVGNASTAFDTLGEISASLAADSGALDSLVTTVSGKLAKSSNLSDLTDASVARTNLGVAIGTNVQAYNSTLADVAGGTYSGDDSITTIGTVTAGSVTAILPSGVVSGSSQVDITLTSGTLDISSRTNLAVSDTTNVDMILTGDTLSANLKGGVVSGSSQINFTQLSGISSNIISASSDTAQVDMIITGGSISANLKGGVVSGSAQVTPLLPSGTVSGSSQVISILSSLNTYTGSNDTSIANLNAFSSSALTRLNDLEGKDFTITLTGDVTGVGTVTNLGNVSFATTVAANSVALGTDTTGNYVATLGTGTGVTIGSNTGEGSTPTIAVNYGSTSNTAVQGNTNFTLNGTSNEIDVTGTAAQALGGGPSYTIGLADTITGNRTFSNDVTITGNLTINGTTTTVNSNTVNIGDNLLVLNSDETGTPSQNGGIEIERGTSTNSTLIWSEANDYWMAGLSGSEERIVIGAGNTSITTLGTITTGTWAATDVAVAHGGTGASDAPGARTNLGLVIGTDVQAYDADLTALGGLAKTDGNFIVGNGSTWVVESGATARASLGVDAAGTDNSTNVTLAGTPDYITISGQVITRNQIDLTTDVTGVLPSANLDADTAHLTTTQTFSGAKTFSAAVSITNSTASTTTTTGALKVTGGVGIGGAITVGGVIKTTDSTASTTTTTGAVIVTGGVGIGGALNVGGDVVAYASSDERLKNNIELISNPIEKVQQLKGVTWEWNENADELQQSLPNVGVIAQDVEKVLPQLVHDRDNGYKGVDYAKLTGLLIEAIKEQQKQIDDLKSRLG
jgi:hypothetical protein